MTRIEFETTLNKLGISFSFHQAMSGSQYITVNGQRYRLADHLQPSHYQVQNYINVSSLDEIIDMVKHLAKPISRNEFIEIYMNGGTYNGVELTIKDGFVYNGYNMFVDIKSAANNLFYNLFKD